MRNMAPYNFKCKDIGMECGFETKAKTKEDLMPKIVEHAKSAHNITEITPDLKTKVDGAIKKTFF
jgi:predicted small metal-binding protein